MLTLCLTTRLNDYPAVCADIFTEESLAVIDGGSDDAKCEFTVRSGWLRVYLGANNTVEDGSELRFKAGNGIVAKGQTQEAATTVFTLRAGKGSERPGKRKGKGQAFSMKLPQQVRIKVWHVLKL